MKLQPVKASCSLQGMIWRTQFLRFLDQNVYFGLRCAEQDHQADKTSRPKGAEGANEMLRIGQLDQIQSAGRRGLSCCSYSSECAVMLLYLMAAIVEACGVHGRLVTYAASAPAPAPAEVFRLNKRLERVLSPERAMFSIY